ncbi:MAG: hypothetical protein H6707_03765 [Deltaproteobacteria bacterium]|nr:hypothetical protein [Deltaproteobacteria bacterium]
MAPDTKRPALLLLGLAALGACHLLFPFNDGVEPTDAALDLALVSDGAPGETIGADAIGEHAISESSIADRSLSVDSAPFADLGPFPDLGPAPDSSTSCSVSAQWRSGQCNAGETALLADAQCSTVDDTLTAALPTLGGNAFVACSGSAPVVTQLLCTPSALSRAFVTTPGAALIAKVDCPNNAVLVSGGCNCTGQRLLASWPISATSWGCRCKNAVAIDVVALCTKDLTCTNASVGAPGWLIAAAQETTDGCTSGSQALTVGCALADKATRDRTALPDYQGSAGLAAIGRDPTNPLRVRCRASSALTTNDALGISINCPNN